MNVNVTEIYSATVRVRAARRAHGWRAAATLAGDLTRLWRASVDPVTFVADLTGERPALVWTLMLMGYEQWRLVSRLRTRGEGTVSPDDFATLYALTRILQPSVALETGTGPGASAAAIAAALDHNGRGHLYTVDWGGMTGDDGVRYPATGVGRLIPRHLRPFVTLRIDDARAVLPDLLRAYKPDLVLLDDDHAPAHQAWEARLCLDALREGAVVLCDDITRGWTDAVGTRRNCGLLGGARVIKTSVENPVEVTT